MEAPSQTFVWNWDWNCDPASAPPVPTAPDGTTVIVWNWHWSCNGAPPPPASVTGATVCVACNIAVSVRIASPGDTGDVVQQIGAAATAAVKGIEAAAQAAAPVTTPAVELPALPVAPDAAPSVPVPELPIESAPTELAAPAPEEDTPRRGAPLTYGAPAGWHEPVAKSSTASPSVLAPAGITQSSAAPAAALERAAPAVAHTRPSRAAAAPRVRAPLPIPSSPVPSDPVPALISVGQLSGHGGGGNANAALTTMTLAGLLLVFLSRVRSIARPRRRAGPVTQPHPPG